MEINFELLVKNLFQTSSNEEYLDPIISRLDQANLDLSPCFVDQSFSALEALEQWSWQLLSQYDHPKMHDQSHLQLFDSLAQLNKNLILHFESIDAKRKANLLMPKETVWIDRILDQLQSLREDNDPWISLICSWFENLALFLRDNPEFEMLDAARYIHLIIGRDYIMTDQYRLYLEELGQETLPSVIFTTKRLFFMKSCCFYLSSYLFANTEYFHYTPENIFEHIGASYISMIIHRTQTISSWSPELLACITYAVALISSCCWWGGQKGSRMKILFSTESIACQYIDGLIRILHYESFYPISCKQSGLDQSILLDDTLLNVKHIAQNEDFVWFLRSQSTLPTVLLKIAECSICDKISLCVYSILGEILDDELLKDLKIPHYASEFYFNILDKAWHSQLKKYKQIPISYILRSFVSLSKADAIQQATAKTNQLPLLIEISEKYPIVLEIIWALSFNEDIRNQLRENSSFVKDLVQSPKTNNAKQVRKATHGILWNLEFHFDNEQRVESIEKTIAFDLMISYSHKDQAFAKELYDELIRHGYRVWIDFDQMHGNVMDAMAYAIERSNLVLICMSNQYQKSNYCRAEAHYAFQRRRKIIPIIAQDHYKPDSWLLFLVGELLYIDFTQHDFQESLQYLTKELDVSLTKNTEQPHSTLPESSNGGENLEKISKIVEIPSHYRLPESVCQWSQAHVRQWLLNNGLIQMVDLFSNLDGPALLYMKESIDKLDFQQVVNSLQNDAVRLTNRPLSLIELAQIRSLFDQKLSVAKVQRRKFNRFLTKSKFIGCTIT